MRGSSIFIFILSMWVLIIVGGGIAVTVLPLIEVSGYGEFDSIISSAIQGVIAVGLVISWIIILIKVKNWIFRKQLKI